MDNETEKFSLTLKVLNNDIVGFSVESKSSRKNWVVIGVVIMIAVSIMTNQLYPVYESLMK